MWASRESPAQRIPKSAEIPKNIKRDHWATIGRLVPRALALLVVFGLLILVFRNVEFEIASHGGECIEFGVKKCIESTQCFE